MLAHDVTFVPKAHSTEPLYHQMTHVQQTCGIDMAGISTDSNGIHINPCNAHPVMAGRSRDTPKFPTLHYVSMNHGGFCAFLLRNEMMGMLGTDWTEH